MIDNSIMTVERLPLTLIVFNDKRHYMCMANIITQQGIETRKRLIRTIQNSSGSFVTDSDELHNVIKKEIRDNGISCLLDHVRLCGDIPESYAADSTEEKLYSKYSDILLAESFKMIGLQSLVLSERADVADVEVVAKNYSFIADAKVFRLSRTAINPKDLKISAMNGWKRGKPYAMVVCPLYQLPASSSQLYSQAITNNVCVFSYSHLAVLLSFSQLKGRKKSETLLEEIFKALPVLHPSKNASDYWRIINKTMLDFSKNIKELWQTEKQAAIESVQLAKEEALTFLTQERERIMRMSHDEALAELIKSHKIETKIERIKIISNNDILTFH